MSRASEIAAGAVMRAARAIALSDPQCSGRSPRCAEECRCLAIAEVALAAARSVKTEIDGISIPKLRPADTGHVYIVENGVDVKIGWATKVANRIADLQVANPQKLRVRAIIAGTADLEGEIHRQFRDLRIRGEWFRQGVRLKRWIADGCPCKLSRPFVLTARERKLLERVADGLPLGESENFPGGPFPQRLFDCDYIKPYTTDDRKVTWRLTQKGEAIISARSSTIRPVRGRPYHGFQSSEGQDG